MNYKVIKDYDDNIAIIANTDNLVNVWLKDSNKLVSPTIWFDNVHRENANVYKVAYHNVNFLYNNLVLLVEIY